MATAKLVTMTAGYIVRRPVSRSAGPYSNPYFSPLLAALQAPPAELTNIINPIKGGGEKAEDKSVEYEKAEGRL